MVTTADIRRIALSLPGTLERPSYGGRPSWRTKDRMFTWIREDPDALVVWVESVDERDALLAAEPKAYFTTPHYDGQPILLVHLDAIDGDQATDLVTESWCVRAPKTAVKAWRAETGPTDIRAGRAGNGSWSHGPPPVASRP